MEILDAFAREAMLFAAVGLLIGGIDDLLVDLVFLVRRSVMPNTGRRALADLPLPAAPARLAIFVPAWDESRVIGAMLGSAVARLDHPDWRLYVGLYPNDPATVDAAAAVAERDPRIRLVIGDRPGPTTKAGCLNTIWRAMQRDDAADGRATRAVVLHDAEDMVHPAELRVFDALLAHHEVIQLPVLPLIKRDSRFVSAHYADEFAETHWTLPQQLDKGRHAAHLSRQVEESAHVGEAGFVDHRRSSGAVRLDRDRYRGRPLGRAHRRRCCWLGSGDDVGLASPHIRHGRHPAICGGEGGLVKPAALVSQLRVAR